MRTSVPAQRWLEQSKPAAKAAGLGIVLPHLQKDKMKRSKHVAAPLLASAALSMLVGCREAQMQRCVNEHNVVVEDAFCKNQPPQQNNNNYHPGGAGFYRYYYGGVGGYYLGSVVTGGGFAPVSGASYSTSRGGFGSTHAGGGEGGGE